MTINIESKTLHPSTAPQLADSLPINGHVFEVKKKDLGTTRIAPLSITQTTTENEVVLKIEKFALTANNISYGIGGEALGYWRFFPVHNIENTTSLSHNDLHSNQPDPHWGRLPVMGYAQVISSNTEEISVGERVWGFFPMASHVKITAGKINKLSFSDVSTHRKGLPPLYAAFDRVKNNPFYQPQNEDYEMLVRGLFTTSWLVDDFMDDNAYFNAFQYLITSASSKTSIALAFAIQQRGKLPSIGITSPSNVDFVNSLGCYDQVITYDDVASLSAETPSILVDMAGSATTLAKIHHHFNKQLRYSCRIGATHHADLAMLDADNQHELPGAVPTFFFAPTQFEKRKNDWGVDQLMLSIGKALHQYIDFCRTNIAIQHTTNTSHIDEIYQQVLSGTADASIGQIITL